MYPLCALYKLYVASAIIPYTELCAGSGTGSSHPLQEFKSHRAERYSAIQRPLNSMNEYKAFSYLLRGRSSHQPVRWSCSAQPDSWTKMELYVKSPSCCQEHSAVQSIHCTVGTSSLKEPFKVVQPVFIWLYFCLSQGFVFSCQLADVGASPGWVKIVTRA